MINTLKRTLAASTLALLILAGLAPLVRAGSPTLAAITLSPGVATVQAGLTQSFTLTGTFSDASTQDVTELATWTVNGGGFTGIPGQKGLFTATTQGTWTLTAVVQGLSATASISIVHGPAASLNLLPKGATLTADGVLPLYVYGVDAQGNGFDVSQTATLSTTDPKGVISATGYTPSVAGTWTLTVVLGALTASTPVTITPGMLAALTVTPNGVAVNPGDVAAFSVQGADAKGNVVHPAVTWQATNDAVGTVDSTGKFTAKTVGQTNVVVQSGNIETAVPVAVESATDTVPTINNDIVAVSKPTTPRVAGEEVTKNPTPDITPAPESTTSDEAPCKNIPHALAVIILIAFVLILGGYFAAIRTRKFRWWWAPPVVLTAGMVLVYALAFCADTYLWWPWAALGLAIVFISVYYQRQDHAPPTSSAPPLP